VKKLLAVLVLLVLAGCEGDKRIYNITNEADTLVVICPTCHHRCN
jgi:hypothetical protein